jgi:hypothetical protein
MRVIFFEEIRKYKFSAELNLSDLARISFRQDTYVSSSKELRSEAFLIELFPVFLVRQLTPVVYV